MYLFPPELREKINYSLKHVVTITLGQNKDELVEILVCINLHMSIIIKFPIDNDIGESMALIM